MWNPSMNFHCHSCSGKSQIASHNQALQRIIREIEMFNHRSKKLMEIVNNNTESFLVNDKIAVFFNRNIKNNLHNLFNDHFHCRMTGNTCPTFTSLENEHHILKNKLNKELNHFVSIFLDAYAIDQNKVQTSLYTLYRLSCGYYPMAAKSFDNLSKILKTK